MREARPNLKYGYVMSVPKMSSTFTIYPTVQPVTPLLVFKYSSKCLISTHKIKAREPRWIQKHKKGDCGDIEQEMVSGVQVEWYGLLRVWVLNDT